MVVWITYNYHIKRQKQNITFSYFFDHRRRIREKEKEFMHVRKHVGKKIMIALEVNFES